MAAIAATVAASLVIAGVASAVGQPQARAHTVASSIRTEAVGPGGSVSPAAVRSAPPVGGASQVVSGKVGSIVGLADSGAPVYYGTEPATMTVQRSPDGLVVTVAPR